jgi:hypothetical protein
MGYNLARGDANMPEYSISQLGKFEECALQYKFIYVDGIKRDEEGVEAFLGQRFHDAMEWLYKERAFRVVPFEELLEYYEKDWAKQWHAEVKIRKEGRTQDDYRLMGRRFIEDYYKRHHPFNEDDPLPILWTVEGLPEGGSRWNRKDRSRSAPAWRSTPCAPGPWYHASS